MIGGPLSHQELSNRGLWSSPSSLKPEEIECLWKLFVAISETWGNAEVNPLHQRSQWLEFLQVKTEKPPSYVEEYRNAILVLEELEHMYGAAAWNKLFFEHGVEKGQLTTRIAHFRVFVVEEFIKVWLTTGGFKVFGAGNYNSYVSGSRFAVRPPYRRVE